ncbi:MAG: hypothetical protein WCK54_15895 [Desulfuromonadales bacterium]
MFKFKSLTVIVSVVMLLASSAFAAEKDKPCKMLTSPADYSTMNVVESNYMSGHYPHFENSRFVSFSDAHTQFYTYVTDTLQGYCNKYGYKGAVNLSVKFSATEKMYYFTAQFDMFK